MIDYIIGIGVDDTPVIMSTLLGFLFSVTPATANRIRHSRCVKYYNTNTVRTAQSVALSCRLVCLITLERNSAN